MSPRLAKPLGGDALLKTPSGLDPLFDVYRAAKAKHDAAIAALKEASRGRSQPDQELVRRQIKAAREEIAALDALRGFRAAR